MAHRHQKNRVDGVQSTDYIPLRYVIAFTAVINETIKPFLASNGHTQTDVEKMHSAW
jgi:hypothetical protein